LETFTLDNGTLKAVFLSYGAILHQLWVKDKKGSLINVIQGLSQPEAYLSDSWSRGAVIGRYAGRLENPITIEEKKMKLNTKKECCSTVGPRGGILSTGHLALHLTLIY
jgi:galactose mutarotase-like enzyme